MSRTYRNKNPKLENRTRRTYPFFKGFEIKNKKGKVRDGTPAHMDGGCANNKGCPYCESNRMHKHKRRELILD